MFLDRFYTQQVELTGLVNCIQKAFLNKSQIYACKKILKSLTNTVNISDANTVLFLPFSISGRILFLR